jgi:hypothetical protein
VAYLAIAVSVIAAACASGGGAHAGRLATIQLPSGFEGTWVRNAALSHVPPPSGLGPDTVRLGSTATYPVGSVATNVYGITVPGLTTRTIAHCKGDTLVVEAETTQVSVGLVTRLTHREYLSSDRTQLISETKTEYPARDVELSRARHPHATPGSTEELLVFDKVQ